MQKSYGGRIKSVCAVVALALLAWLLFGEPLDRYTAIGAGIIFAANLYIARREMVLARRTVTDPRVAREGPAA